MDSTRDMTFDEKIQMVESGQMSIEEAAQDPNSGLAFTTFQGKDPGPKLGDADYATNPRKRKITDDGTDERPEAPKASKENVESGTTKKQKGNKSGGLSAPWFEDEEDFAYERLAENPTVTMAALAQLINEEFADKPYQVGDKVYERGQRTVHGLRQRFSKLKAPFLDHLDANTDRTAASMGWQQDGGKVGNISVPKAAAKDELTKEDEE